MKESKKNKECECDLNKNNCRNNAQCGGAFYGLGFIGAAIFFVSHATSFWIGVLGLLKAIVWPAILTYKFLGM